MAARRLAIATLLAFTGTTLQLPGASAARSPVTNLRLSIAVPVADVGDSANFTLAASSFPPGSRVTLSFLAAHHGFTGGMTWGSGCKCFRASVLLARRIHPLERAVAKAIVKTSRGTATASTSFYIRGMAPDGRDYAPGGRPLLQAWVGDPSPSAGEYDHFCGWVKTVDGLGVAGYRLHFVVHFPKKALSWTTRKTGSGGVICTSRSIGSPPSGQRIYVDVWAGGMHARTSFVPS